VAKSMKNTKAETDTTWDVFSKVYFISFGQSSGFCCCIHFIREADYMTIDRTGTSRIIGTKSMCYSLNISTQSRGDKLLLAESRWIGSLVRKIGINM